MCIAEYLSKWRKTIFMDKLFFNKTDGTCNKNEHFSNLHNLHSLYMVNYHRSWNITHEWNTVININANTNSIQRFAGQLQICNEYSMFVDLHLHFFCVWNEKCWFCERVGFEMHWNEPFCYKCLPQKLSDWLRTILIAWRKDNVVMLITEKHFLIVCLCV